MSWKLSRTVLRGGVTGNGGTLLGLPIHDQKQPVFITLPDQSPFAFAGLWDVWRDKQNPETVYRSCTIITRDSSDCLRKAAEVNSLDKFQQVFRQVLESLLIERMELKEELVTAFMSKAELREVVSNWLGGQVYDRLGGTREV